MDISREADSLLLHQIPYIEKLGESFNVCSDPKVTTPLTTSFEKQDDGPLLDASQYSRFRSLIGVLLYIATCTRPDICFAVNMLARRQSTPTLLSNTCWDLRGF
jgi:hypothetical protein